MTDLIERVAAKAGWLDNGDWMIFVNTTVIPIQLTERGQLFLLDALLKAGWRLMFFDGEFTLFAVGAFSHIDNPDLPTALMEAYMAMESAT